MGAVTTDEKSMLEFEQGEGQNFYLIPFYLICAMPASPILLFFGPVTVGLSWLAWWLFIWAVFASEIWIFVGLYTMNLPLAMLQWMPNEANGGVPTPAKK